MQYICPPKVASTDSNILYLPNCVNHLKVKLGAPPIKMQYKQLTNERIGSSWWICLEIFLQHGPTLLYWVWAYRLLPHYCFDIGSHQLCLLSFFFFFNVFIKEKASSFLSCLVVLEFHYSTFESFFLFFCITRFVTYPFSSFCWEDHYYL